MNFLSNLILLRFLTGLKSSFTIVVLAYIYLGYIIFKSEMLGFEVLYIAFTVVFLGCYIYFNSRPEKKDVGFYNDPDILAYRERLAEARKEKEDANPYE